jgi:hypothetical protein
VGLHGAPDLELVSELAFSAETVLTFTVFLLTPGLGDHRHVPGLLDSRAFGWTYLYVLPVRLYGACRSFPGRLHDKMGWGVVVGARRVHCMP